MKSRSAYARIWVQSVFAAILALSPFVYMMQITERVYNSHSWETLGFITGLILFLMVTWAFLDHYRNMALKAVGHRIDFELRQGVYNAVHRGERPEALRAYADIATLRHGLTGTFVESLMDASMSPIFVAVLFMLHPIFGLVAILYIVVIALLSARSKAVSQRAKDEARAHEDMAFAFGMSTATRRETVRAMNILPGVREKWEGLQSNAAEIQLRGDQQVSPLEATLSLLGQLQMVLMIGIGAVLYLLGAVTANVGMAAFIVMMRGVSPVLAVARNMSMIGELRSASARVDKVLAESPAVPTADLPPMRGEVSCDNLGVTGRDGKAVLTGIRFAASPGTIIGVVGPSGAGKSTLLRMLSGAGIPSQGSVMIDGFPIAQWPEAQRGADMGYLPQAIDLLPGTILQNVTRFMPDGHARVAEAMDALRLAGALDIVQGRGRGIEYLLMEDGAPLSGGQRQRIGLARAFFGRPKVIVLDEPNSALDAAGEKQLAEALCELRDGGSTIFVSTHKLNMLTVCDQILVIMNGFMHSYSSRDDMLSRLTVSGNALLSERKAEPGDAAANPAGNPAASARGIGSGHVVDAEVDVDAEAGRDADPDAEIRPEDPRTAPAEEAPKPNAETRA